jgi:hypothetical protein
VRTQIALTLVLLIACPIAILACCGSYRGYSNDDEVVAAFRAVPDIAPEEGPFRRDWMLAGVEQCTAIATVNDTLDVSKLFVGMWSSPPDNGKGLRIEGGFYSYVLPPSALPPFDSKWLSGAVWPLTFAYFTGKVVDSPSKSSYSCWVDKP